MQPGEQKNTTDDGGVRYSISRIGSSNMYYVQADRQVISGTDAAAWGKQVEKYINETIRENKDIAIPTSDGHILLLTGRSAYKLTDRHVSEIQKTVEDLLSDNEFFIKANAAAHIDELIQIARFTGYQADENNKHKNDIGEDGFNYFEAYFRDADGGYYRIPFSAGINAEEETTYSIGKIRKRSFPASRGSSSNVRRSKDGRKASGSIIYTSEEKSQEIKSAIAIAWEKAIQNDTHQHQSRDMAAVERANRSLERQNAKLKENIRGLKKLLRLQKSVTKGRLFDPSSVDCIARYKGAAWS